MELTNGHDLPSLESNPSPSPEPNVAVIDEEPDGPVDLLHPPDGTWSQKAYWYMMWLGNLIFFLTVPDVRRKGWRKTYPLAFFICILWIGSLSYLVAWFITVIGSFDKKKFKNEQDL